MRSTHPAIVAFAADLTLSGSTLEPLNPAAASDAIALDGGSLSMSDSIVQAWPGHAVVTSTNLRSAVSLTLDRVTISACSAGIDYETGTLGGRLSLRDTTIQSQSDAVAVSGRFTAVDLGTSATPGNNQLTTASGPALSDHRSEQGAAVDARGTVLNGVTYSGDVLGPADVATGYHIEGPNTIHF